VGDVKKIALHQLQTKLGTKMGQTLYNFSRGIDDRPLTTNQQRQSVSAEINVSNFFYGDMNNVLLTIYY
jgi:DNA repair protein REV1